VPAGRPLAAVVVGRATVVVLARAEVVVAVVVGVARTVVVVALGAAVVVVVAFGFTVVVVAFGAVVVVVDAGAGGPSTGGGATSTLWGWDRTRSLLLVGVAASASGAMRSWRTANEAISLNTGAAVAPPLAFWLAGSSSTTIIDRPGSAFGRNPTKLTTSLRAPG
jgi:hypothetical protein